MVAYHTIHWSCDSVVIVSCMHVITNCVTCLSIYVVYGLRVWNKYLLLLLLLTISQHVVCADKWLHSIVHDETILYNCDTAIKPVIDIQEQNPIILYAHALSSLVSMPMYVFVYLGQRHYSYVYYSTQMLLYATVLFRPGRFTISSTDCIRSATRANYHLIEHYKVYVSM